MNKEHLLSKNMTLKEFNKLDKEVAIRELIKCCGSFKWASLMIENFPFASEKDLLNKASQIWKEECKKKDWLEAFTHHPKIGDFYFFSSNTSRFLFLFYNPAFRR